jgi:hypothetical protein
VFFSTPINPLTICSYPEEPADRATLPRKSSNRGGDF